MLISIIIPVYNAEKFLDRSIQSVINQSYKNIELVLVNDGSTDGSEMICSKYALSDKRIKVITQKNSGPSAARNTGIRHATGDFIFFLDADDYIDLKTFEILLAQYDMHRPDMVMSNFGKSVDCGEVIKQRILFTPNDEQFCDVIKILSEKDIVSYVRHFLRCPSNHLISYCWARLYKTAIIKENNIFSNENMRLFEDFVFNLQYLRHSKKIVFINEPLYIYTMNSNHVSASMSIVNAGSLLHDMSVFKTEAREFLELANTGDLSAFNINKEIGHALTHYVIIFLVRSCRQVAGHNRKKIYNEVDKLVNAPILKESLRYYTPSKGNTRILPVLMKLKLVNLIIFVCKHKAYKRYGKPERHLKC